MWPGVSDTKGEEPELGESMSGFSWNILGFWTVLHKWNLLFIIIINLINIY